LHFFGQALGDALSELHDHHSIHQPHDEVHVVFYQQDRHAFAAQAAEEQAQGFFLFQAQPGGGFIE